MRYIALVVFGLALVGCSKEDFSYEFNDNGCVTKQKFDSKDKMCNGLKSDSLNSQNGTVCAVDMRKQKYESECGGSFTRTN